MGKPTSLIGYGTTKLLLKPKEEQFGALKLPLSMAYTGFFISDVTF